MTNRPTLLILVNEHRKKLLNKSFPVEPLQSLVTNGQGHGQGQMNGHCQKVHLPAKKKMVYKNCLTPKAISIGQNINF